MGRGKSCAPSLIQDKEKRIMTFENRKRGLEKKAYELATLCDVDIAMIMFGPDDEVGGTNDPSLWPEDPLVADKLVNMYQCQKSVRNCSRNTDIASIYQDRVRIVGKEVEKLKKTNIEDRYPVWDEFYDSLPYDRLLMFGNELDNVVGLLQSRIDFMKTQQQMFQSVPTSNQLQGLNSFDCVGNEGALVFHNSEAIKMEESLSCFGFEGSHELYNSQNTKIMDNIGFNYFGNEGALGFHNSQKMKIMAESSSWSNNFNSNYNIVPSNFAHMIDNANYYLPWSLGFEDNFARNNDKMVMVQMENQYPYCAPPLVQMPDFIMPRPMQYVDPPRPLQSNDPYSHMVNDQIGDGKIDEWRKL